MRARLLIGLLGFMVWAVAAQADPLGDFGVQRPRVQKPAPNFALKDLEGVEHRLDQHRGRIVLLHFWATWCQPCRREMPLLQRLWHEYRNQGLTLVCINVDRGNRSGIEAFMREIKLRFPTLLDADGKVRNRYEVRALPTSYLIGRDGRIIGRIIGERDWASSAAAAMVQALLQAGKSGETE